MTNLNNQLQAALESGDYSRMAKAAKLADIFSGQAPKKADLESKIQAYLAANVDIDGSDDTDTSLAGADNDDTLPEVTVNFTPKATGYIGGQAEFYYWPEFNVYAQNVSGQAIEPKFDPIMWETMKTVLPKAEALKTNVVKAATKAAEATKYTYNVTVNFSLSFESLDPDLGCSDLSEGTLLQILDDQGVTMPTTVTFNVVKGKVKSSSGQRGTSGGGNTQERYAANDASELKPLSIVLKQILMAASDVNGLDLNDYAKYGKRNPTLLGNHVIDFERKGYLGAFRRAGGRMFFDSGAMYEGFTLADIQIKV